MPPGSGGPVFGGGGGGGGGGGEGGPNPGTPDGCRCECCCCSPTAYVPEGKGFGPFGLIECDSFLGSCSGVGFNTAILTPEGFPGASRIISAGDIFTDYCGPIKVLTTIGTEPCCLPCVLNFQLCTLNCIGDGTVSDNYCHRVSTKTHLTTSGINPYRGIHYEAKTDKELIPQSYTGTTLYGIYASVIPGTTFPWCVVGTTSSSINPCPPTFKTESECYICKNINTEFTTTLPGTPLELGSRSIGSNIIGNSTALSQNIFLKNSILDAKQQNNIEKIGSNPFYSISTNRQFQTLGVMNHAKYVNTYNMMGLTGLGWKNLNTVRGVPIPFGFPNSNPNDAIKPLFLDGFNNSIEITAAGAPAFITPNYTQAAQGKTFFCVINSNDCSVITDHHIPLHREEPYAIQGIPESWINYGRPYSYWCETLRDQGYNSINPAAITNRTLDDLSFNKSRYTNDSTSNTIQDSDRIIARAETELREISEESNRIPHYISGNFTETGEGDVFARIWNAPHVNPYRSFGFDYYRVFETSSGISYQANYKDFPDGVFGVRPDLFISRIITRNCRQDPQLFPIGYGTTAELKNNTSCNNHQWLGWDGWGVDNQFGYFKNTNCDNNNFNPSRFYYNQISLGNQHGLVSLGIVPDVVDEADFAYKDPISDINFKQREKNIRYLIQFSGKEVSPLPTDGISRWSTEQLDVEPVNLSSYPLKFLNQPIQDEISYRIFNFTGSSPSDRICSIEVTGGLTFDDITEDFCRLSPTKSIQAIPHLINKSLLREYVGFVGATTRSANFNTEAHPIWKPGNKPPIVHILDAEGIATLIIRNTDPSASYPTGIGSYRNASWNWISAGTSGNNCSVLAYTHNNKRIHKFLCWGSRYNVPSPDPKYWPTGISFQEHTTSSNICTAELTEDWKPCQVDVTIDTPIFYLKTYPFSSYWIRSEKNPSSFPEIPSEGTISSQLIFNTRAKVITKSHDSNTWIRHENQSFGTPLYFNFYQKSNDTKDFFKKFNTPNGKDYFNNHLSTIYLNSGTPFTINNPDLSTYLIAKTDSNLQELFMGATFQNWDSSLLGHPGVTGGITFVGFDNSDIPVSRHTNYRESPATYLSNNLYLPSWTPNYPLVSGGAHLLNILNPTSGYTCGCDGGQTGCCTSVSGCTIDVEWACKTIGGVWSVGPCQDPCTCNPLNTSEKDLGFAESGGTQNVILGQTDPLCQWTVSVPGNCNWITAPTNNATGTSTSIAVTVAPNQTPSSRTCTITVTASNGTKNIIVTQTGGGGGSETGACCLPDGSCNDDKTPTECNSLNGDYRGKDTLCAQQNCGSVFIDCCDYFVGPCCKNDSCAENTTPQECHKASGIFLGFNRTCDDCPTTS